MPLMSFIHRFRNQQRLVRVAENIATRSHDRVWQRTGIMAARMTAAEARGYIRARAVTVIHREAERHFSDQNHLPLTLRSEVMELAVESLIESIQKQLTAATHPALRQAA